MQHGHIQQENFSIENNEQRHFPNTDFNPKILDVVAADCSIRFFCESILFTVNMQKSAVALATGS